MFNRYIKQFIDNNKSTSIPSMLNFNNLFCDNFPHSTKFIKEKIYFNDTNLNISGYYTMQIKTLQSQTEKSIDILYCIIKIKSEIEINIIDIYKKLTKEHHSSKINYNKLENLVHNLQSTRLPNDVLMPIDSFFIENKDSLWDLIKGGYLNMRNKKTNILIHGPSGSGKSSFIYRVALVLKLNIVEINLLISSRYFLDVDENIIKENSIVTYSNFDDVVEMVISNHIKYCNNNDNEDSVSRSRVTYDQFIDIFKVCELHKISHSLSISFTNNINRVRTICPELFYPGRIIDIEFKYATVKIIQEISKFYFNKKIKKRIPEEIKIPTGNIITLALECSIYPKSGFDLFEEKLLKLF